MRPLSFIAALALIALPGIARADGPQTDLVFSGAQSVEITASDTNSCYIDSQNALNAQITDPAAGQFIAIDVAGTVGDHPAMASDGHAQLTMLAVDTTRDDPFVNWAATGGTITVDSISTQVALDDGSASTRGALGHIDADMSSPLGTLHVSGPFACHLAG
ncbi:MAG: hypothetical protein JO352_03505 [Chloroflexi bacterium]|nr:hypothetical protein [Chloroflexota bacterium]MBV9597955.1 hypothetical protein [Chloroflexota bacterium]